MPILASVPVFVPGQQETSNGLVSGREGAGQSASVCVRGGLRVRVWTRLSLWLPLWGYHCVCVCPGRALVLLVTSLPPVAIGQSSGEGARVPVFWSPAVGLGAGGWAVTGCTQAWVDWLPLGKSVVALANGLIWLGVWWRKDGA